MLKNAFHSRFTRLAILASCICGIAGCGGVLSVFDSQFLTALGLNQGAAILPGEAPAVLLEVENRTSRVIEFRLTWRDSDGEIHERTRALAVEEKFAESVFCPVEEITLGDVSDLTATGAIVRLGIGGAQDAFVEVEPFGVLLQESINYDCGDSVSFQILPSSQTASGYQLFAFIRRSGAQADDTTAVVGTDGT